MSSSRGLRAGLYARVSTDEQSTENQLLELRRYASSRGWDAHEYVDQGQSGAKEARPALQRLLADARRRRLDVVVCWRLDRLGRNLRHLIVTLDDLTALGVAFVSLGEGIDATTPAGRLQLHLLGAIAEFERARIAERVRAGLERARRGGKRLGRPNREVPADRVRSVGGARSRRARAGSESQLRPSNAGGGWSRKPQSLRSHFRPGNRRPARVSGEGQQSLLFGPHGGCSGRTEAD